MSILEAEKPSKNSTLAPHNLPNRPEKTREPGSVPAFSAYSGPIPPPDFLVQYEAMVPGIAKKFLEEPRLEAEHRRSLENKMVNAQTQLAARGQKMAFIIAVVCITASFAAIFLGHSLPGVSTLFFSITALVGVFIYGKNKKPQ